MHVLDVIEKGLAERDKAKIGLKWPLAKATIYSKEHQSIKELDNIIKSQLNIKQIELRTDHKGKTKVKLDTTQTPELEAEGYAREISRKIQALRKKSGLVKTDKIKLEIISDIDFSSQEKFIKERVNATKISLSPTSQKYNYSEKGKIKNKAYEVKLSKT